jgi:plastocyanin
MRLAFAVLPLSLVATAALALGAQPAPAVTFTLQNHAFSPASVQVPSGRTIEVVLVNRDSTPEEFDSDDLGVEEVAHPHETIRFPIGPLKPGTYAFMGEHHPKTAEGTIIAR